MAEVSRPPLPFPVGSLRPAVSNCSKLIYGLTEDLSGCTGRAKLRVGERPTTSFYLEPEMSSPTKTPVRLLEYLQLDWESEVPLKILSGKGNYDTGVFEEVWELGEVTEEGHLLEGPPQRFRVIVMQEPAFQAEFGGVVNANGDILPRYTLHVNIPTELQKSLGVGSISMNTREEES